MSDKDSVSPRVNSAHLPSFIGKTVRLPCKVLSFDNNSAKVVASDGGEVLLRLNNETTNIAEMTYCEVIGNASDGQTIKVLACVNLGNDLDMSLVNKTIEMVHDRRYNFLETIFS